MAAKLGTDFGICKYAAAGWIGAFERGAADVVFSFVEDGEGEYHLYGIGEGGSLSGAPIVGGRYVDRGWRRDGDLPAAAGC